MINASLALGTVTRLQFVFAVLVTLLVCGARVKRSTHPGLARSVAGKLFAFYVIVHVYLAAILAGGEWLVGLMALTAVAAARELARALLPAGPQARPFRAIVFAVVVAAFLLPIPPEAAVAATALLALAVPVLSQKVVAADRNVAATVLTVTLAAALPLHFLHLHAAAPTSAAFLFVIILVNDAFAEGIGRLAGRHPWFNSVSPNKTLEGAAGGALASVVASFLFAPLWPGAALTRALVALLIAAVGNLGDLVFSALKRSVGTKDFDNSVPAHGGILDRMDSLLYCAGALDLAHELFTRGAR